MDRVFKHRWQTILFFTVLAVLFLGIFYGAIHGPWDPRFRRRMNERMGTVQTSPPPSPIQGDHITLARGQPLTVGKSRFVFHGIEKRQIHIAVYLLELDPEVAYHHLIPIKAAKKGLRLGGQGYVLTSYGKNRIKLRRQSP
jgi:hypothetical protein